MKNKVRIAHQNVLVAMVNIPASTLLVYYSHFIFQCSLKINFNIDRSPILIILCLKIHNTPLFDIHYPSTCYREDSVESKYQKHGILLARKNVFNVMFNAQ